MASVSHRAPIHLGLDVHRDTISVEVLTPDQQVPEVDRIPHDEPSVRGPQVAGWYRHITLALLAHAFLAVTRAKASGPERAKGGTAA